MKIFICNRSSDTNEAQNIINKLLSLSDNSIAILQEITHSKNWQYKAKIKLQEVDFVLFLIGKDTFESDNILWEFEEAKKLNKQIVCLKLPSFTTKSIKHCIGFQVFDTAEQCLKYLNKTFEKNQNLLLEQYKIMVNSTEKVTEQRLKVNNLFFTVTSSILSVAIVLGKALEFSIVGILGMLIITTLSFLTSFYWEKLIKSYGDLNKGKFIIIDKLEKQLRTNMFEDEWQILLKEIKYEPNSQTEIKIIKHFRIFIVLVGIFELIYLCFKV
jgi:hypothetical protein